MRSRYPAAEEGGTGGLTLPLLGSKALLQANTCLPQQSRNPCRHPDQQASAPRAEVHRSNLGPFGNHRRARSPRSH